MHTTPDLPLVADCLGRADHFFSYVLGRRNREPLTIEQVGVAIDIRAGSSLLASIPLQKLELTDWDRHRFLELQQRVTTKGSIYGTLSSAVWISPDEQARLTAQLARRRTDLSRDFRELLRHVDRSLGVRLSDHFRSRSRDRDLGAATENQMAGR